MAVGPLAAAGPFPLLLTGPDALDPRITAYLAEHDVANVVLVGGTAAIAPAVQEALEAADITVTRLAGGDRADTSRLAAELFEQLTSDDLGCASGPARIGLAPAQRPKLALTAGPPARFPMRAAALHRLRPAAAGRAQRSLLGLFEDQRRRAACVRERPPCCPMTSSM